MENCLNGQRNRFKSCAEKSPPPQKTAYILGIYVITRLLIWPKKTTNRSFHGIRLVDVINHSKIRAGSNI